MKKNEEVWIVVGKEGTYVGFWYSKKDAKQGHIDHLGYLKWKEAYANGDRLVKAKLKYSI
jgi:hypothetical protein